MPNHGLSMNGRKAEQNSLAMQVLASCDSPDAWNLFILPVLSGAA
jgi:hypothetical protein